jgi:hypothetical protein
MHALQARGVRIAIADALSERHLMTLGEACAGLALVTGGSGMAMGLILDDERDRRKRRLKLGLYGFQHAHYGAEMGNKTPKVKQEVFLSSLPSFGILDRLWVKEQRARPDGRTTCA